MKTATIDTINIIFMLCAMIVATLIPFELFLFVYAILGPLHYLTEINWLQQKNFYLPKKKDYRLLIACLICITGCWLLQIKIGIPFFIFLAFSIPIGLRLFSDTKKRILSIFVFCIVGLLLSYFDFYRFKLLFSIFLPTLIHVFLFTAAFLFLGCLKSKNKIGFLSVLVFIGCTLLAFNIPQSVHLSIINNYIKDSYSSFFNMNYQLISILDTSEIDKKETIFMSEIGIKVMRFIAFAYTYHYLNWFSKTAVIQWHKTTVSKLIAIGIIWLLSIALYASDYTLGLRWLFILSLSHVVLEFPLNHLSFLEIKNQFLLLRRN